MSNRRKFLFFLALVLLPATLVGISNFDVFPTTYWQATIMLLITVIIAGLFTWHARNATQKTWKYVMVFHLILCSVLCANVVCHWLLAREVNAARDAVNARHVEEDRRLDRQLKLNESERVLLQEQGRNNRHLPFTQRRNPVFQSPTASQFTNGGSTEEDVKSGWFPILTWITILEVSAAIFLGAILMCLWEWDRNHNNIADHLESPSGGGGGGGRSIGFGQPAGAIASGGGRIGLRDDDPKT